MIFSNWESKSSGKKISKSLLWEYNLDNFDWYAMRTVVLQRVIERGWLDDFYAAIKLYGGIDNVKEIIKEIPCLSEREISFVCLVFGLRKEDLKCYIRKQLREKLMNC